MSKVYIMGDLHGVASQLGVKHFPKGRELTKEDYVIIAGDFGYPWGGKYAKDDKYWLNWLDSRPWTTLFVDGNHENFDLLEQYPLEQWNGGLVHKLRDSVIHLTRGQVFQIAGSSFFTFGGASSIDKELRKEGVSYWQREIPSKEEYEQGLKALNHQDWEVDYVITHTCPLTVLDNFPEGLLSNKKEPDDVNKYLDVVYSSLKYKHWYFGHYHGEHTFDRNVSMLYSKLVRLL